MYKKKNDDTKKTILYLRTDYNKEKLLAGGSVSHTLGVIEGFLALGHSVIVASSLMIEQFDRVAVCFVQPLTIPARLQWLKWKVCCLISNFFFHIQAYPLLKKHSIDLLYQRYAVLNCTGVILSWWFKIPLILEYNGSEVWLDTHWSKRSLLN